MKCQSHPKSTKTDAFKQKKYTNATALIIIIADVEK